MSTLKTNNIQHVDRSDPSIIISTDGGVSIAGTLTYEDVTNIDAVGIVTGRELINAQKQIHVGTGVSVKAGGLNVTAGITTVQALQATSGTFSAAVSGTTGTFSAAVSGTTGTFTDNVDIADKIIHTGDSNTAIRFPANDTISFETAGSEAFRVDASGNIGINNTSPSYILSVNGDSGINVTASSDSTEGVLSVVGRNSASSVAAISRFKSYPEGSSNQSHLAIETRNSSNSMVEALRITSTQNVGIATNNPAGRLDVHGSGSTAIIKARRLDGNGGYNLFEGYSDVNAASTFYVSNNGGGYFKQNLLIGTTDPGWTDYDELTIATSGNTGMTIRSGTSSSGQIAFADGTSGDAEYRGIIRYGHTDDDFFFCTNGDTTRMKVASNIIETGSKTITGGDNLAIQGFAVKGVYSGSGSVGKSIELISGYDSAVKMAAVGYNLTDINLTGSTYGGDLTFHTQPLYSSPTTPLPVRVRISSKGQLVQGNDPTVNAGTWTYIEAPSGFNSGETIVQIVGDSATTGPRLELKNKNTGANACSELLGADAGGQSTAYLRFLHTDQTNNYGVITFGTRNAQGTPPVERVRITKDGQLLINRTSPNDDEMFAVFTDSTSHEMVNLRNNAASGTKDMITMIHVANSGDRVFMRFKRTGSVTNVGTITTGASSTAYNTSSDYRLKENAVAISDGITRLKTLKPYRFNFKVEPDKTVDGFFAHEVTAVPEAVHGEKDAVETTYYTDGDTIPEGKAVGDVKEENAIDPQSLDYSKFTPLLTAALQEAVTRIETLEAQIAALTGG